MNSTQHRYEIAAELNIANEFIQNVRQSGTVLFFSVNGADYSCRLTKTGAFKKHSVRKD